MSFILKYPLGRQHLKLYFYHNVFSMYFKFESEFNGEILLHVLKYLIRCAVLLDTSLFILHMSFI